MARLVTYNVHRCVGTDRRLDLNRVADVLAELRADVICLQELDVGRARTNGVDQARALAERLSMQARFHPAMAFEGELYGDAILTPWPERLVRAEALPTVSGVPGLEPRGAVWSAIEIAGATVNVINTHLGLVPQEQRLQAAALAGRDWLGHPDCAGPVLLAGDFNATSITRPYKLLTARLDDSQRRLGLNPSVKTFPSAFPAIRIDHCFVSSEVRVTRAFSPDTARARTASDHRPLAVDFEIAP